MFRVLRVFIGNRIKKDEIRGAKMSHSDYDEQKRQWSVNINTKHVSLKQNTEEKGRGKGLEVVWVDENEWNEIVV